jgi:hypothetical protein
LHTQAGAEGEGEMGLKVSPPVAATLTGRAERTIRLWIASGKLPAEPSGARERRPGVGPYRWLIDTDDLARVPGVHLVPARLAELEAQAAFAGAGENVLERLARLERAVATLRQEVAEIREAQSRMLPHPREGV